jgi:hypothetical protein
MARSTACHYTNLARMADKLKQLVHEFAWGRVDLVAHREADRIDAERRMPERIMA